VGRPESHLTHLTARLKSVNFLF